MLDDINDIDLDLRNKKQIIINGTNNRYQMKKVTGVKKIVKTRELCKKWDFSAKELMIDSQIECLSEIYFNSISSNKFISNKKLTDTMIQHINIKLNSYRHQDTLKNIYEESCFITLNEVILSLIECKLQCYYCKCNVHVLYDTAREQKQWSIDRINNDKGHNIDNYYIACLGCNLERRRVSDTKFKFTKQLVIKKQE